MKNIIRQIVIVIILISFCLFADYAINLANFREYNRSEVGGWITYPKDVLLFYHEKIAAHVGHLFGIMVFLLLGYLFFIGIYTFHTKYLKRYNINVFVTYVFSIWIIIIGIKSCATSQYGQSAFLDPFFGKKIYYGGYENVINSIRHEISTIRNDKNLSNNEKEKKIKRLESILTDTLSRMKDEELFSRSEQEKRNLLQK
jgi:hypothetical protein